jgi:hypothetical protein
MPASRAPFLSYLTVFRSRLGLVNLILNVTPLGHQPDRALRRRVLQVLEDRIELDLDDVNNDMVFQYLVDKKMLGGNLRSGGRYRGVALVRSDGGTWHAESALQGTLTRLAVYQTDLWFADPDMPSTIGVPTPDNVKEVIEFAFQLHILDHSKNSWTSSGHLVNGLRNLTVEQLANPANPFLLGAESAALLWILLERDGLFLRELLRFLSDHDAIRRDDVADALPTIANRAVDAAAVLRFPSQSISEGRKLVSSMSEVDATGKARAPGVREHRSSPRLEWLTDLGYLSKNGLPKNAFEYRVTANAAQLLSLLDSAVEAGGDWCFNAALSAWRANGSWEDLRTVATARDEASALGWAYAALRRPIGPAPLRHVAFITGLLWPNLEPSQTVGRVIALTQETPGASLSGGRMTRSPENIYMTDESLKALGAR